MPAQSDGYTWPWAAKPRTNLSRACSTQQDEFNWEESGKNQNEVQHAALWLLYRRILQQ
jgi:hypothetical protein